MSILADYQNERQAFDALLHTHCDKRILVFYGESGSGKTSLLSHCRERARQQEGIFCVNIDLKGTAVSVAEIFSRTGDRLGWERLSNLQQQVADLQNLPGISGAEMDRIRQTGFGNQINVTLQVNDPTDREQRRVALTESLFEDIKGFEHPVVFIFDTFEQASTEVQDWVGGSFLARVERVHQVRILVAGQRVPDENNIDWGYCCTTHHLRGVPQAEHWLPIVEAMELRVPAPDPLSWLRGICGVLKGQPSEIMKYLKAEQERSPRYE
jgi:energy-coupling factor transporter ATP-binding protein EcfA2